MLLLSKNKRIFRKNDFTPKLLSSTNNFKKIQNPSIFKEVNAPKLLTLLKLIKCYKNLQPISSFKRWIIPFDRASKYIFSRSRDTSKRDRGETRAQRHAQSVEKRRSGFPRVNGVSVSIEIVELANYNVLECDSRR